MLVSYADTPPSAYAPGDVVNLGQHLDAVIRRNSGGQAWVEASAASITLPSDAAFYGADNYVDQVGAPPSGNLEADCLRPTWGSYYGRPFRIFLTPAIPRIDLGFAAIGAAFVSDVGDILALPVAHEFGHCLGFEHAATGIMDPETTDHPHPVNWADDYDSAAKQRAHWP